MNFKEIKKIAEKLDNNKVNNIIIEWSNNNKIENIKEYSILVKLGDSKELACATVLYQNETKKESSNMYYTAYNL